MNSKDYMRLEIAGLSSNESFARVVIAAFAARLDPTLEEISDIKTAVSEAVTNAIIHAYEENEPGPVFLSASIEGSLLIVEITDSGRGIPDVEKAREPFYTTRPELERSGMGFAIMESFMDEVVIASALGKGTTIRMLKEILPQVVQGEEHESN